MTGQRQRPDRGPKGGSGKAPPRQANKGRTGRFWEKNPVCQKKKKKGQDPYGGRGHRQTEKLFIRGGVPPSHRSQHKKRGKKKETIDKNGLEEGQTQLNIREENTSTGRGQTTYAKGTVVGSREREACLWV